MMRPLRLVAVMIALAASACGYSTGSLLAGGQGGRTIRSVWVPIVSNDSFRRQFEEPLTDAIIKEIQSSTNLVIKRRHQNPDSVLRVRLLDVQERTLIENRFDVVTEGTVRFSIGVEWQDMRTGKKIPLLVNKIQDDRRFTVTRGESFASAGAELAEKMAEKIVEGMYRGMQ